MHIKNSLGLFKKLQEYIKKRNFYYRLLLPYSIISILVVFITAFLSWNVVGRKYNDKIKETNYNTLVHLQIYTDEYLYTNLLTVIIDNFMGGYATSKLNNFYQSANQSATTYMDYFNTISDISLKNNYIDNVTLFRKEDSYLIDSQYGVGIESNINSDFLDQCLPYTFFNNHANGSNNLRFLTLDSSKETSRPALTLLHSVPLYSDFNHSLGYIALSISSNEFISTLNEIYHITGGLLILDENNQVLIQHLPMMNNNTERTQFIQLLAKNDHSYYNDFSFQGIPYAMACLESPTSGWKYISAIPLNTLNAEKTSTYKFLLITVFLTALFSIILVHVITAKVYQPLDKLKRKALQNNMIEESNDIEAINNALIFLENQVDDMKITLSQNKEILVYKTIMDLLYSHHCSEDDIQKRLTLYNISFKKPGYYLLILEFESSVLYSLTLEQQEYITSKCPEFIHSWFSKNMIHTTSAHAENRLVTILNLDEIQFHQLYKQQHELLEYLETNIPIKVNIAISNYLQSLTQISNEYTLTCDYFKYSFMYGYSNVFTPDIYAKFENTGFKLTLQEYNSIAKLIRANRITEVLNLLKNYQKQIINSCPSYESVNIFLRQLYQIIFQIGIDTKVFEEDENKQYAITSFQDASDFKQNIDSIISILELYQHYYEEKNTSFDSKLIASIINYIENNYYTELSLSSISNHFNVSSSHLSRLFKQITGTNLSVYIVNYKLEKAAELILANPDNSISKIAESLGYYTPAYFTKLFREKYGMTPTQYRKSYHKK